MSKGTPCVNHGLMVCSRCVVITDAARRMSDHINAYITFKGWDELINSWLAFRLDNGDTDGAMYPSKHEAVRHQSNPYHWAFFSFRNSPGGVTPKDCQIFLNLHRHVYDNGGRLPDPDDKHGGPDLILSNRGYDFMSGRRWN
jgi:hypothetical protein